MIESFFEYCANGFKIVPGVVPKDIPLMDLFKPEYLPTHYSWMSDGVTYTRKIDGVDTCFIVLAPNRKYLIVMQDANKYGPDNLLILRPDGTEDRRLKNPYLSSPEFKSGDTYEFLGVRSWGEKVLVKIAVTRERPGKSHNAEPTYVAFYDCDTWEASPLEFIDSRNL